MAASDKKHVAVYVVELTDTGNEQILNYDEDIQVMLKDELVRQVNNCEHYSPIGTKKDILKKLYRDLGKKE